MDFKEKNIQKGILVVAKSGDLYEGLVGEVKMLRSTDDGATLEVAVHFEKTNNMRESHPQLNGSVVNEIFMTAERFIYFPYSWLQEGYDTKGNTYQFDDIVCKQKDYKEKVEECWLPY